MCYTRQKKLYDVIVMRYRQSSSTETSTFWNLPKIFLMSEKLILRRPLVIDNFLEVKDFCLVYQRK